MFWKWYHINKNCNGIVWKSISFYCENKSILFRRSYSSIASLVIFWQNFWIPMTIKIIINFYPAICSGPNDFCSHRLKSISPCCSVKLWTLWIIDAHAEVKGIEFLDGWRGCLFLYWIHSFIFFNQNPRILSA